jgi:hypothetical protein
MCRDNRFFPFFVLSIYQTARDEGQACASLQSLELIIYRGRMTSIAVVEHPREVK